MAVWSWTIREAWLGITWRLVRCPVLLVLGRIDVPSVYVSPRPSTDPLSNAERTFLAWLRTSLAFASIGIAVTQLFRLNTTISERDGLTPENPPNTFHLKQVGKPLGATFLGIAILVLLLGGRRYFESQYWIIRGKFPASRGSIFLITGVAVLLIITSLVVVCVVDPSVFEKR